MRSEIKNIFSTHTEIMDTIRLSKVVEDPNENFITEMITMPNDLSLAAHTQDLASSQDFTNGNKGNTLNDLNNPKCANRRIPLTYVNIPYDHDPKKPLSILKTPKQNFIKCSRLSEQCSSEKKYPSSKILNERFPLPSDKLTTFELTENILNKDFNTEILKDTTSNLCESSKTFPISNVPTLSKSEPSHLTQANNASMPLSVEKDLIDFTEEGEESVNSFISAKNPFKENNLEFAVNSDPFISENLISF